MWKPLKITLLLAIGLVAGNANAVVTITGALPTTLANGEVYKPIAGDTVNVSRNGGSAIAYIVTSAQATAGSFSFSDTGASVCNKDAWSAAYTSVASGLTSAPSPGASTTIDGVGCVVKFVPGLQVK